MDEELKASTSLSAQERLLVLTSPAPARSAVQAVERAFLRGILDHKKALKAQFKLSLSALTAVQERKYKDVLNKLTGSLVPPLDTLISKGLITQVERSCIIFQLLTGVAAGGAKQAVTSTLNHPGGLLAAFQIALEQKLLTEDSRDIAFIGQLANLPRMQVAETWAKLVDFGSFDAEKARMSFAEAVLEQLRLRRLVSDEAYPSIRIKLSFAIHGYFTLGNDEVKELLKTVANDVGQAIFEGQVRWLLQLNPGIGRPRVIKALHQCSERFAMARKELARDFPLSADIKDPKLVRPSQILDFPNLDTRHPPDIGNNSHIIAVCGINDELDGDASPDKSGWFVSDFYLWMQVLQGMGKSQKWLTCDDPRELVKKYIQGDKFREEKRQDPDTGLEHTIRYQTSWTHGYLQGDAFEKRRVVLDRKSAEAFRDKVTQLPRGRNAKAKYLQELHSMCAVAEKGGEPLVVMIFGHGAMEKDFVGGISLCVSGDDTSDLLTAEEFAAVVNKYPKLILSLFMTSCYSGHWVEYPRIHLQSPLALMAGSQAHEETFSYHASHSQRHCGGLWTAAAVKELMNGNNKDPDLPRSLDKNSDEDQVREYIQMQYGMVAAMRKMYDLAKYELGSTPLFDQEEIYERFDKRTGFPLASYKVNYEKLALVDASDPDPRNDKRPRPANMSEEEYERWQTQRESDWYQRHPEMQYLRLAVDWDGDEIRAGSLRSSLSGYGSTGRGLKRSSLSYLARRYYQSCAGRDLEFAEDRPMHRRVYNFFKYGDEFHWQEVANFVNFRVCQIEKANRMVYKLGLDFPMLEAWNWKTRDTSNVFLTLIDYAFFDPPKNPEARKKCGPRFLKPYHYLAAALSDSSFYGSRMRLLLDGFVEEENTYGERLAKRLKGEPSSMTSTFRKRLARIYKDSLERNMRGRIPTPY